ncbi:hypothetical protein EDD75_0249 [Thermodesulfitimonas autotrophica]|uniref:DUF5666 domain-containing protein n=1 Tax=Thermodesulfitimonas autotrophica TaxID=1894989 RepID=A0A3N5AWY1_9THEO|nr:hypothetical protein [Thermodesulfitimonas autotrophica]RPF49437.1 hypothetical protein EDD75_0249 [Thermodesulfitimonas autotrophica]
MRKPSRMIAVLLALCFLLAFVFPAAAETLPPVQTQVQIQEQNQVQTQVQAQVYSQVYGVDLPADLVAAVNALNPEQLRALAKLIHERLKELAPVEFAGVVTKVYGDTFTVVRGGKGYQVEKTFTLTTETRIVGEGNLKGTTEIKPGLMVRVTAAADGKALLVRLIPAKKAEALTKGKAPGKKGAEKKAKRAKVGRGAKTYHPQGRQ